MIAMSLMAIAFIYFLLFVIVGFKAPTWGWRIIGWLMLLSPIIWKTWDIPVGHYKFKKLCEQEAGIKIYVQNPKPAKRIRLEGDWFGAAGAEDSLLRYPTLQQVEAQDRKYNYVRDPVAYALYERDINGKMVSKLMDTVNETGHTRVTYSAPSQAEYFMSFERNVYPFRIGLERYTLRSADNTIIGTAVRAYYFWSEPDNTILGRTFKIEECGCDIGDDKKLINLIAKPQKIKNIRG